MDTLKNTFRVIALLLLASVSACLLFPVFWSLMHSWVDFRVEKVFRRIWMITIILALIIWRKDIGIRQPSAVGFALQKSAFRNCVLGVGVSFVFLSILTAIYYKIGYWHWQLPAKNWKLVKHLFEVPFRGAIIAGTEEYIFRGLIFLSLVRQWGWIKAALFCSLIFSSLHFVEGHGLGADVNSQAWNAGFLLCADSLRGMASRFQLFPAATGLFLVGMIMCYATIRTGNLWYAAGLHGGWIWYSSLCKYFFDYSHTNLLMTGGVRLFDGIFPIVGMFIIFPITYLLSRWKILNQVPIEQSSE